MSDTKIRTSLCRWCFETCTVDRLGTLMSDTGVTCKDNGNGRHEEPAEFDIILTLDIDNVYEEEGTIKTVVTVCVPPMPPEDDEELHPFGGPRYDWEQEYIFNATGTGQVDGDACYFVSARESSRPDLIPVGTEWDFD